MEQMAMARRVWPIHVERQAIRGPGIFIEVEGAEQETAMEAAMAGIYAYNRDPRWLDPSVPAEGPSPRGKATSKKAALDNWPRSGSQREKILNLLTVYGDYRRTGLTREEIGLKLGMFGDTVRPRVLELIQGGWLIETEHTRLTRKGNDSVVLLASQKAVEYRG